MHLCFKQREKNNNIKSGPLVTMVDVGVRLISEGESKT